MKDVTSLMAIDKKMTFAELHRRRRMMEAEIAIEEIQLVASVRKLFQPFHLVRSVSGFALNNILGRKSVIYSMMYGYRSARWIMRLFRHFTKH